MKDIMFTRLIVQVTDTAFPKTMAIPITERVTLGRSDIDDPSLSPDIDFVACNAIPNGISRSHAAIDPQPNGDLMLYDLGSRNGTSLNGLELKSHEPYIVRDGDKIHLGRLKIMLYLE
jgi:pSer/pThr/pTyr-binding forkhead associated (FHA) protein